MTKTKQTNQLRLTMNVIDRLRALPPSQRARRYWDSEMRNFYIQFSKAGTASFMLRYRKPTGGPGEISLGRVDEVSLSMARGVAKDMVARRAALKIDPMEARRQQLKEAANLPLETFGEVSDAFLKKMASSRSKKRQKAETYVLQHYVYPKLQNTSVKKITTQMVLDLCEEVKNGVASRDARRNADGKTTANQCWNAIKRVMQWACDADLEILTKNVAAGKVPYGMKIVKRVGRLDEHRYGAIWNAVVDTYQGKSGFGRSGYLALLIYMVTLQRPIDVARAKRCHFDMKARVWMIPEDYTKTGYEYFIPLTELSTKLIGLALASGTGEFLFPSNRPDGYVNEEAISDNFRRRLLTLQDEGLIPAMDIVPYDARRYGRTQIRHKLGFGLEVAEAVINHAPSRAMETRYDVFDLRPKVIESQNAWSNEILKMAGRDLEHMFRER